MEDDRQWHRFCQTEFAGEWRVSGAAILHKWSCKRDDMLKLAREGALRVFEGSQDAYPAWQKLFRQLIHTQRASSRPRPLNISVWSGA